MASANFKLSSNGGSSYLSAGTALAGANLLALVPDGTNYAIKAQLDSTAGVESVSWTITSADETHIGSLPTVTTNADKTCTFNVSQITPSAYALRCVVNSGVDGQGDIDLNLTKTLAVKVGTKNEYELGIVGETYESGSNGHAHIVNNLARAATKYVEYPFTQSLVGSVGTTNNNKFSLPANFLVLGCCYWMTEVVAGAGTVNVTIGDSGLAGDEFVQMVDVTAKTTSNTMGLATTEIGTAMTAGNNYRGRLTAATELEVIVAISVGSTTGGAIQGVLWGIDLS